MKNFLSSILFCLVIGNVTAQEQFGNAIFTVPAGWQMISTKETVTLEKPNKKGVTCKIIISATKEVVVTNETQYLSFRNKNGGKGIIYQNQRGTVIKYEAEGLTSFFSKGTITQNMGTVTSYFYSLSNGTQTLYYQLLTNNNECITEFNQFMSTLAMELEVAQQVNARKKSSPSPAPAAPAPMM